MAKEHGLQHAQHGAIHYTGKSSATMALQPDAGKVLQSQKAGLPPIWVALPVWGNLVTHDLVDILSDLTAFKGQDVTDIATAVAAFGDIVGKDLADILSDSIAFKGQDVTDIATAVAAFGDIVGKDLADILSDSIAFKGQDVTDIATAVAAFGDLVTKDIDDILSDSTAFKGQDVTDIKTAISDPVTGLANIEAIVAALTNFLPTEILADNITFNGADIPIIKDNVDKKVAGRMQEKPATIDIGQIAGTYDLFTGSTHDVILEHLVIRMSGGAGGGNLVSIAIQTDDVTPQVLITALQGAVGNLTDQAVLYWDGKAYLKAGYKVQITLAGGAATAAKVCDVVCGYRSIVDGGYLV